MSGSSHRAAEVLGRLFDVRGTRVIVTGAASGLGFAMAEVLSECGARVTLADITIRLSDRRIVQLTRVPYSHSGDAGPRRSPDGRLIAFTRTWPRRAAIYAVRLDGRGERLIADDAIGPAWSPDGRRLAFVQGVSGDGRPLTLSVMAMSDRRVLMRTPLRRPRDADGLSAQAWRP